MRFHGIPWSSMKFYDVPVNQSVPTEANRGLISYMWLPRKVREAKAQESIREAKEEAENLRKIETKELKAATALYKKQMATAAKVACEEAEEVKKRSAITRQHG
jgi:hypothetical protein